jgi:hypothetical protein
VEPGRAQTYGNDPDAVEVHRAGGSGYGEQRSRAEGLGPDIPASGPTDGRTREEEVLVSRGSTGTNSAAGARRHGGDQGGGEDLASARRDSIRWGPIWAGLITALTTFLLLQLLAIGLGLVGIGPEDGGGGWVPAIIGLIAFFTGGAVWALGTVLILLLSALGLGQLFGALGNVAGQVNPGSVGNAANAAQGAAPNVSAAEAAQALKTGAIGAFFGLLFSALASMLGGLLGGRSSDPIGRPTDARRD